MAAVCHEESDCRENQIRLWDYAFCCALFIRGCMSTLYEYASHSETSCEIHSGSENVLIWCSFNPPSFPSSPINVKVGARSSDQVLLTNNTERGNFRRAKTMIRYISLATGAACDYTLDPCCASKLYQTESIEWHNNLLQVCLCHLKAVSCVRMNWTLDRIEIKFTRIALFLVSSFIWKCHMTCWLCELTERKWGETKLYINTPGVANMVVTLPGRV